MVRAAIDIRSAAREARNRVRSLHTRARHFERVVLPAQANVLEQTLLQYNAMQIGVLDLLRARRELLEVELSYVDTLRDYWTGAAGLDALLAGRRVASSAMSSSRGPSPAETEPSGGH